MLDFIEKTADDEAANSCIEQFYSLTLDSFQSTNNERLWLKTNIKLARLWFAQKNFQQLAEKLRDLHKACQKEDGTDDPSKGTLSLEVYALEIQMYAETRNNKRLKVCVSAPLRSVGSNIELGSLPASFEGQVCSASPQDYGHHSGMWWKDAHERRFALRSHLYGRAC
jgi:hypothetical protein